MSEIVKRPDPRTSEHKTKQPQLGDWFWVTVREYNDVAKKHVDVDSLRCITHIGSNYVEMSHANGGSTRVHFDEFEKVCRPEPDAERFIQAKIDGCRNELKQLMGRIKELTTSLAITPQGELPPQQETAALVLAGSATSMKDYKTALIKAQEEQLPELFDKIRKTNERMAMWMKAPMLPLEAQVGTLDGSIDAIKQRVFNVELYAGLVEEVTQVRDGQPAPSDERVHLLQRRHYMDEECLVNYQHGGMEFRDIGEFNEWIARDDNFTRIFPFPRCVVAFQVRREMKNRVGLHWYIRVNLENADKRTFLYMRNGDQLFMLSTEIDFGAKLFPDIERNVLASGKTLWAEDVTSGKRWMKGLITDDEYQGLKEQLVKRKKAYKALKQKHAATPADEKTKYVRDHEQWEARRRVEDIESRLQHLEKFTPDSVYYDDIAEYVHDRMMEHNRLVLILQGLFDRSPVFHPHPAFKLWEQDGYEAALKLVYDDSRALVSGDKPSFKAYVDKLRESLTVGSVVIGQEDAWLRREADRENNRYRAGRRERHYDRYKPYGDPGPGFLARVEKLSRDKQKVTFHWTRERQSYSRNWVGRQLPCKIVVPVAELFNVSAYTPGDFKIFFNDPRSRAEYLQWAPFLLAAEDYHAGKAKLGECSQEHNGHASALTLVPDDEPEFEDDEA